MSRANSHWGKVLEEKIRGAVTRKGRCAALEAVLAAIFEGTLMAIVNRFLPYSFTLSKSVLCACKLWLTLPSVLTGSLGVVLSAGWVAPEKTSPADAKAAAGSSSLADSWVRFRVGS